MRMSCFGGKCKADRTFLMCLLGGVISKGRLVQLPP